VRRRSDVRRIDLVAQARYSGIGIAEMAQLEFFSDGVRVLATAKRQRPGEADLQAKLDAARMRMHEIVIPQHEDVAADADAKQIA
jgi:hypothetical protein